MEVNSGCIIKDLRIKYGIKQIELECSGLERSVISKLERGIKEVKAAHTQKLAKQFNLVGKKRNITFDCEITSDLLLGRKENDIDRLISNFKNGGKYALFEIDEFLSICTPELGEELIRELLEDVLLKNLGKYREEIKLYCMKRLNYTKDKKKICETYAYLIGANLASDGFEKYSTIIQYSEIIKNDIHYLDKSKRLGYYNNVATAYRNLKQYNEALLLIKKALKIKGNPRIFGLKNTEAIIYTDLKKYNAAEKIYKELLNSTDDIDFSANTYSNLADLCNTKGDFQLANEYIDKAFEFINDLTTHYKYNLYYVKLQIEMNQNKDIFNTFIKALGNAKELFSRNKIEKILDLVINYYKKNCISKLEEIVTVLYKDEIETKATLLMEVYPLITKDAIRKMIFEIKRY